MSLANDWHAYECENVSILAPENNYEIKYRIGIFQTLAIFKSYGIVIPHHTVIIFPVAYSANEVPVSYPEQNLIMIFPLEYPNLSIDSYVMFQYFHELGHLITGNFDQPDKWIGELLACSCNYFFFPKDTKPNSFYDLSIAKKTLNFEQNRSNYSVICNDLAKNQYLVYKGNNQIQSALYAYSLEHKDFDFIALLKEFFANRNSSEKQQQLILKIKNLFK